MSDVFISYARSTAALAAAAAKALRAAGYSVWLDENLPAHRPYASEIEAQLRAAKAALVIWSADAVYSEWVLSEANLAREQHKLVQAVVDGARPPMPFDQIQYADLAGWSGNPRAASWRKVVESVAALAERGLPEPEAAPAAAPATPAKGLLGRRRWVWIAALGAAVVILGAGVWLARGLLPSTSEERVAVLPFDALGGSADVHAFADGLNETVIGALNAGQIEAISREDSATLRGSDRDQAVKRFGVGLILDGTAQGDGSMLRVSAHIDDPAQHVTLWSNDFSGPAAAPAALQAQIAAHVTDVTHWALVVRRASGAPDAKTQIAYIRAAELIDFDQPQGNQQALELLRMVTAKSPNFPNGHSSLALALAGINQGSRQQDPEALADARQEAHRALALNPHLGEAYQALALMTAGRNFAGREAMYEKGAAVDPDYAWDYASLSRVLIEVGRYKDALAATSRAAALLPFSEWPDATLVISLAAIGRQEEARRVVERDARLFPDDPVMRTIRFNFTLGHESRTAALALVTDPATRPYAEAPTTEAWRTALSASTTSEKAAASRQIVAGANARSVSPTDAFIALAYLGDLDGAFDVAGRYYADPSADAIYLSVAPEVMHRDPRYMALAARIGLVDYWRASGRWPDFCSEPGFPYDCHAQAAIALAAKRG